ncbi:lytic transglycosylase domain-containing protein [bacterium]|nr:lytic transglycosylase domain-containing protein [bacterium]
MIQSLISSGGQQAAIQRSLQLQSYVNPPQITQKPKTDNQKSFAEVLKTSQSQQTNKTGFGNLVTKTPSADVKAKILGSGTEEVSEVKKSNKFGALTGITNKFNALKASSIDSEIPNVDRNAPKAQIISMIDKVAKKHGVDEKLVRALVRQESGFNPNATSHCGAMGLMQLMPATAKSLGVTDAYNPVQNVEGGVKYLKNMLNKYNGNVILALAAYNAGPGAVDKYGSVPPYAETQNYVKSILANYL